MISALKALADTALRPLRHAAGDAIEGAVEWAAVLLFALIAVGFGLAAATIWLAERHGALKAVGIMALIFLALAVVALLIRVARTRARRRRRRLETQRAQAALQTVTSTAATIGDIGALLGAAGLGGSPTALAARLARSAARSTNPWILIAAAGITGYVTARRSRR